MRLQAPESARQERQIQNRKTTLIRGLSCQNPTSLPLCLRMVRGSLQFIFAAGIVTFFLAAPDASFAADAHHIVLTDVDGNQLSLSDGHVTLIAITTRQDQVKASLLGDSVPLQYLGDPRYRLVTVMNFQKQIGFFLRPITLAMIRSRIDAEARRLQPKYLAKHLSRNPRWDIFLVADFDGSAVSQFGVAPSSAGFFVFLFDGTGQLVRQWSEVPSAAEVATGLASAKFLDPTPMRPR
jgi:hypothetical protein